MFVRATPQDFPYIRALIREGARLKSFEEELAGNSAEAEEFFVALEEAVASKRPARVPVLAFLYQENAVARRVGFVVIRGIGSLGYELWLTAIDRECRGRGLGRRMLTEFLATPEGKRTCVAQCRLDSSTAQACAHILGAAGFIAARVGKTSIWMAREDLPPHALQWMKTTPLVSRLSA